MIAVEKSVEIANVHLIESVALGDTFFGPPIVIVTCTCHAPDEDGVGRADFTGLALDDAMSGWLDHVDVQIGFEELMQMKRIERACD